MPCNNDGRDCSESDKFARNAGRTGSWCRRCTPLTHYCSGSSARRPVVAGATYTTTGATATSRRDTRRWLQQRSKGNMHYGKNVFAVHPALCHALLVFVVHRPKRMAKILCRAFFPWHTANEFFSCPSWRLTLAFVVRRLETHNKDISLSCVSHRCTAKIYLVVRFPTTHGKEFFKKMIFVLLFISPLQKYYFVLYIFQSYTCLYRFTIFNNYVPVKQFLSYMSNLNCKCITE
jgi:hypothetical protein